MSKTFTIFLAVFSMIFVSAAFYYGRNVEFSAQWPLYEALRATASIIFAVVGAWLAIIYPDRLRFAFGQAVKASDNKIINIGKLLSPAIHSTFILSIILIVGVLAPILKQINFLIAHKELFRGLSYGLLAILTLWQLVTIILTLVPADMVKRESDKEAQSAAYIYGLTKNMQVNEDE